MGDKKLILIVDDEPDILKIVIFRLQKSGYEVITAQDGKTGLQLADKKKPDLILLDLRLPVMDGSEVYQRLKSDENLKKIPVIFLTASAEEGIKDKMKELGSDGYIIKPFEPEELLDKVKKYIA